MAKHRGTTTSAASETIQRSKQGSAATSTKSKKAPGQVFGTSSQFKGVGVGRPGDPRK